uniref:Uncharacterized protein n=1 Tax=Megaselia scalaris TaxID=36166 RepID=T1GAC5_MEGSC
MYYLRILKSPLSKGYFHKAIQQSGSIFNAAYPVRKGKVASNTRKLVRSLNCEAEGESLKESIDGLKKVDIFEIV